MPTATDIVVAMVVATVAGMAVVETVVDDAAAVVGPHPLRSAVPAVSSAMQVASSAVPVVSSAAVVADRPRIGACRATADPADQRKLLGQIIVRHMCEEGESSKPSPSSGWRKLRAMMSAKSSIFTSGWSSKKYRSYIVTQRAVMYQGCCFA